MSKIGELPSWWEKSEQFDWDGHRSFLQNTRFSPLFDRAFSHQLRTQMGHAFGFDAGLKQNFFLEFDRWVGGGRHNRITGLAAFPFRDFIQGVTHSLDDLHIVFGSRLVCLEKEYSYHRRMKPDFPHRRLETLREGDVLVLAIPFAWHGDLHPQNQAILDRCLDLGIPVHADGAWNGCLRGFEFCFDHPAIHSVSFSLSKGLGLGSHRVGVRYSKNRHAGPVTIVNDFGMEVTSVMACGLDFMRKFGSDYLQDRYGSAYDHVCGKLGLRPTKALHMAFGPAASGEWVPMGLRPFLRYLVDDLDEFE